MAPTPPGAAPAALDKVRKLLALATSPNPHEAAVAAARAQAMIEAHRLQAWMDADRAIEEDPDPIVDARDEPLAVGRRIRRWKTALASVLGQANGCVAYTLDGGKESAIVLVGRARDRAAVTELWGWLVQRIEWLSATHGAGANKKWHEAFRLGVVDSVAQRLSEGAAQARSGLNETALVVVDPARAAHRDALDRFVSDNLKLGGGRALRVDAVAWQHGKNASTDLDLP
ncbi:MAG: DUF2786 domain-containing protein [Nannocystaceae bacterium]|nr:DUF2786 domain-containing protein [Nannocystaceae bacterium]